MGEKWVRQYRQKRRKTWIGILFGILLFMASPYILLIFPNSLRLDGLLYTVGFLSILYFGIFSLKCPNCHSPIYIGDAFSIQNCKECGSKLRHDNH